MKVILKEDVEGVGSAGSVVEVSAGFARNYLIPKNLGIITSTSSLKEFEHRKKMIMDKLVKEKKKTEIVAQQIETLSITISRDAGEDGKLFGSVTAKDIEDALREEGFNIDKKKIMLDKPIKNLGVFQINVKLHPTIIAKLKIWVVTK